ncbi:MAG: tRNA (adenosine(37)-N6)-threonylcarbamoyltransferase complex transferase subunit TsaD [Terrimicrobiaceae bacterium]
MSLVLALETSCDETAAAVLDGPGVILANVVYSQMEQHAAYGGVVPEVASRSHLEVLPALLKETLMRSGKTLAAMDAFAATTGPGLAPALLVGANAGRGLAAGAGKPFLAINHIEGHLLSPFFGESEIPPHVALVVSGGHTLLFDVTGFREYQLLGRTLDDAAGEAFDKVAKLLGLGYPGGVAIERLAAGGDPHKISFPRAMLDSGTLDFSFSGLKTSVRYFVQKGFPPEDLPDICASFQEAVIEVLARKLTTAARQCGRPVATLSGGVSFNSRLVERASELLAKENVQLRVANPALRTDNALMIAYVAALSLTAGQPITQNSDISPNFDPLTFPN